MTKRVRRNSAVIQRKGAAAQASATLFLEASATPSETMEQICPPTTPMRVTKPQALQMSRPPYSRTTVATQGTHTG